MYLKLCYLNMVDVVNTKAKYYFHPIYFLVFHLFDNYTSHHLKYRHSNPIVIIISIHATFRT